ncbi:hypothetical protein HRbin04_01162 [archaeon HR04]|nr:hypothetical protein HRbin04_01162 [archaeon HR04]
MKISRSLLLRMIPYMDGLISMDELSSQTGISISVCNAMLNELIGNGIGSMEGEGYVRFTHMDRISAVVLAMRLNASMDEVARVLHWKDFEMLTAEILEANGYSTARNVRVRARLGRGSRRGSRTMMEVDVVGLKYVDCRNTALLIDCKHWHYISTSELARVCEKQVIRARTFIAERRDVDDAIPAVVVLNDTPSLIDGVPIVPITRFREFLNELYSILDELHVVRRLELEG